MTEQTAPAEGLTRGQIEDARTSLKADVALLPEYPFTYYERQWACIESLCDMALRSLAPQASPVSGIGLVKMMQAQRDEIYDAAMNILREPTDGKARIALRQACVKVPSYRQRLDNIMAGLAEVQASDGQGASAAPTGGQSETTRATQSEARPTPPQGSGETPEELLARLGSSAGVMGNLPENPGYNGSVLLIDDEEAARIAKDIEDAIIALTAASAQSAAGAEADELDREMEAWTKLKACRLCYGAGPFSSCVHFRGFVQACARPAPPAVTEGMVMVPREPTFDMQEAGREKMASFVHPVATTGQAAMVYAVMLSASPRAKEGA